MGETVCCVCGQALVADRFRLQIQDEPDRLYCSVACFRVSLEADDD